MTSRIYWFASDRIVGDKFVLIERFIRIFESGIFLSEFIFSTVVEVVRQVSKNEASKPLGRASTPRKGGLWTSCPQFRHACH
jgi:hypothetical protein